MLDHINEIMRWVVAPIAAFVWYIYMRQQKNNTDIAVIKSELRSYRMSNDREIKEMRETVRAIFSKLDSIEQSLRK